MDKSQMKDFMHKLYSISGKVQQIRNMELPLNIGIKINSSALSTLNVINHYPERNMSEISMEMGLTKGAVSQMACKLEQKGLIEKKKSKDNAKDIFLMVTDKGKQALIEYDRMHDRLYEGMFDLLSQYQEQDAEIIWKFLCRTDQFMELYKKAVENVLPVEENKKKQ